jgi:hypothetical protein
LASSDFRLVFAHATVAALDAAGLPGKVVTMLPSTAL